MKAMFRTIVLEHAFRDRRYSSGSSVRTQIFIYLLWGYAVAYLVEALCYKPDGRGFDSR
jgi:hypothetical protein